MKSEEVLRRICVRRREACLSCVTAQQMTEGLQKLLSVTGKTIPQSRLRRGAFCAPLSLPCARGGGSAAGGDERVDTSAARIPGVSLYPAAPQIRDSNPSVSMPLDSSLYAREP